MTVGMNIKAARKSKNITQAELSAMSGLSRSYLGDLESDRYNPSVETLIRIAHAINMEPASLMDGVIRDSVNPENNGWLSAFDRKEFRGLTPDEIESLSGIAGMFKKSRQNGKNEE